MARQKTTYEKQYDKFISTRRWEVICGSWVDFAASLDPVGSPPQENLHNNYLLKSVRVELLLNQGSDTYSEATDGIREILFQEGLFLHHKASYLLQSAVIDISNGRPSSAILNAYHSSFCFAKALIHILGVGFPSLGDSSILLDVWSNNDFETKKRNNTELRLSFDHMIRYTKSVVKKIEQRHVWAILFRLLNATKRLPFDKSDLRNFNRLNFKDINKQRNIIFYSNNNWLFDDLHTSVNLEPKFGFLVKDSDYDLKDLKNNVSSDFSIVFGMLMFKLSDTLFKEVARYVPDIQKEMILVSEKGITY